MPDGNLLVLVGGGPQVANAPDVEINGNRVRARRMRGVLRTSNATPTAISIVNSLFTLENNTTYAFRGMVAARGPSGANSAAYMVQGCVKRGANAAATALVGTPLVTAYEDTAGMDLGVTADTTNGYLALTATGVAATVIDWEAQIEYIPLQTAAAAAA